MGRIQGCGEVHPTVKVESDVEIGDIHYIDINKECPRAKDQYLDWEDVPNEHYDVIWPVYCPFYGILSKPSHDDAKEYFDTYASNDYLAFFTDVWNKLRPGGKMYFQTWGVKTYVYDHDLQKSVLVERPLEDQLERIQTILMPFLNMPWGPVYLAEYSNLPVRVFRKDLYRGGNTHFFVFQKPNRMGGKRTRRARRRQTRRRRH